MDASSLCSVVFGSVFGMKPSFFHLGVIMVTLTVTCHRVVTYFVLYPFFRLLFGTLYPAYASYKAVRTKNVKEYVSNNSIVFTYFRYFFSLCSGIKDNSKGIFILLLACTKF